MQLKVIDPLANAKKHRSNSDDPDSMHDDDQDDEGNEAVSAGYAQSYLQNPYYFMFASLAKPDDDAELHWLKVCTACSFPPHPPPTRQGFDRIIAGWTHEMYNWFRGIVIIPPQGPSK